MAFFTRKRFSSVIGRKKSIPDGVWIKCQGCAKPLYRNELDENNEICPHCEYHYRLSARKRIAMMVDTDSFVETYANIETSDPLRFKVGDVSYLDKIVQAQEKAGASEALVCGTAAIHEYPLIIGVMDSAFIMGSMGSALGEKFCRCADDAVEKRIPFVIYVASGGARMQEGILSLMQMAKTANAVRTMNEAGAPFITVLTDPTTGGVYASLASLGDIIIAEPGAQIGFTGPRLIEGALKKVQLPEGFQTAEYQFKNGFVDRIVHRNEQRDFVGKLVAYLSPQ